MVVIVPAEVLASTAILAPMPILASAAVLAPITILASMTILAQTHMPNHHKTYKHHRIL